MVKNLVLYIGSILCFSFLLAVASFTYSRLYSTMEKECEKYKRLVKIGLSRQELYKILSSSVRLIVILPFVLGLVYMWIGVFVTVIPFIYLYNGERGPQNIFSKYFFYLFYPGHLWLIATIAYFVAR